MALLTFFSRWFGFSAQLGDHFQIAAEHIANLPDPIVQKGHHLQQCMGLVDAQAIDRAPERAGHRQAREFEKPAQHGVQAKVGKGPDAVKPYKQ